MAMRNIDKIKELNYELGRWQKKAADQQKDINKLRSELEQAEKGMLEINRALDSIMAEATLKFGAEVGVGAWEMVLPLVSVLRNTRDYAVSASVGNDNDSYIVRVERRKPEGGEESDADGDKICPCGCIRNFAEPLEHCDGCDWRSGHGE